MTNAMNSFISFLTNTTMRICFTDSLSLTGEGLRGMHSSYREISAIRGQLGSLRHHVSEGVCQTQEGAIGKDQDLE